MIDVLYIPKLKKKLAEETFQNATNFRKYRQRILKQNYNQPVLHDWIFILEWSHVVMIVCALKKIKCNYLKAPLNTLNFFVTKMEKTLSGKKKDSHELDQLKKQGGELMCQIYAGVKRLQMAIIQADREKNLEEQKKRAQRKKSRNVSHVDLLKEKRQ